MKSFIDYILISETDEGTTMHPANVIGGEGDVGGGFHTGGNKKALRRSSSTNNNNKKKKKKAPSAPPPEEVEINPTIMDGVHNDE